MTTTARRGLIFLMCAAGLGLFNMPAWAAVKKNRPATTPSQRLSLTTFPARQSGVSDAELVSTGTVKIEIRHQLPIDENSLRVTLRFDGGPRLDVTKYFVRLDETTYQSSMLHQFARTLFSFMRNTTDHVVELEATTQNNGRVSKAIRRIPVYPVLPVAPPPMQLASR